MTRLPRPFLAFLALHSLAAQESPPASPSAPATDDEIVTLEDFVVRETALADSGDLLPTSRPVESGLFSSQTLADIPRSVTVLTPETLRLFAIDDFNDLARVAAGASSPNFYGVPGTPFLRGDFAGTFYNGMQRVFQRNESPTSFGSLESMDVVKGPAPANFGTTQAGGYVNFIPKSPFYDKTRGALRVTAGSYDYTNSQFDLGGPLLLLGKPAAFRVSLTGQRADSYYSDVGTDYVSLYGAVKMQLAPALQLYSGAEYYDFKSNENAGWNRVTQELIDSGRYIDGEVAPATSAAAGGFVDPADVPFAFVPFDGPAPAMGIIPPQSFRDSLSPELQALLGPDGQYTQAYFDAGGELHTVKIDGDQVLADARDFADSQSLLYFLDLISQAHPDQLFKAKLYLEYFNSDKRSSYGYAFRNEQFVAEEKLQLERSLDTRVPVRFNVGGSVRYQHARQIQDYSTEPFSRRDISNPAVTANSVVLTGSQHLLVGDTRPFWSQSGSSDLGTLGLFSIGEFQWTGWTATTLSARLEGARFRNRIPAEHERSPDRGRTIADGGKNYTSLALGEVFRLPKGFSLYATAQQGTALNPSEGGVVAGEGSFAESELYEAGIKGDLLEHRLYLSLGVYYFDKVGFDSVSQVDFPLRGKGLEFETVYAPSTQFRLVANFTAQRTQRRSDPGFRFAALSPEQLAQYAGGLYATSDDLQGLLAANNPDLVTPGAPELVANIFVIWSPAPRWDFGLGPTWRDGYWHNYERTIRLPSSLVWNATAGYRRERYEILLTLSNLFNEDYFYGSDPGFASNALITKAPPLEGRLSFTYKF